jgi:hypothetical protein
LSTVLVVVAVSIIGLGVVQATNDANTRIGNRTVALELQEMVYLLTKGG